MMNRARLTLDENTLASGLRVLCAPLPATHRAAVAVYVRTGSRFEPPELGGVSHFLEHMLHRGTPAHPSAHALALAFEELGSELGAATYVDHALLSAEAPLENLGAVIDLLGQVVKSPIFSAIEIERGIVREEILESLNDRSEPISADELVVALSFPNHGLGRPITGTIDSLERFDVPTLERFHREHYGARSMVVSVSGPVDSEQVFRNVERSFADLPSGNVPTDAPPAPLDGPRFAYVKEAGSQSAVRLAFRAPGERDPLEPAADLLLRTVDDGMSTRLYHSVCDERGLSYDVSASYEAFADSGLFALAGDSAHERVEALLEALYGIVRELRDNGPNEAELTKAKRRYAWHVNAIFDSPLDLAAFLGLGALTGVSRTPWERADQLAAVDRALVHEAARKIFDPSALAVAIVGQLSPKQRRGIERLNATFAGF